MCITYPNGSGSVEGGKKNNEECYMLPQNWNFILQNSLLQTSKKPVWIYITKPFMSYLIIQVAKNTCIFSCHCTKLQSVPL